MVSDKELFHVHTFRCQHAEEVPDRTYIERAIDLGAKGIWFTDHAPFPGDPFGHRMKYEQLEEYLDTLSKLKNEYSSRIAVHIGLETEYFPSFDKAAYYRQLVDDERIELLLLGQHMAEDEKCGYSFNRDQEWLNEEEAPALGKAVCDGIESGYFGIVAHPDRCFRKRKCWTDDMSEIAEQIITTALRYGIPLEQNESSKRDKNLYWDEFWEQNNGRCSIVRGLDAHFLNELELL